MSSIDKKGKASKAELLTEITKLREEINGKFLYVLRFSELSYYYWIFTSLPKQKIYYSNNLTKPAILLG